MQMTVTTIIFGLPEGQRTVHLQLPLGTSTMTVRQLIARKVTQEVAECRARRCPGLSGEYFSPEQLLRAARHYAFMPGEVDDEIARAQHAFTVRDYMIVINDQRIVDPEATVTLLPETRVEFIKILPLVGG